MAPLIVYDIDPVTGRREKARKPEKLDEQWPALLEKHAAGLGSCQTLTRITPSAPTWRKGWSTATVQAWMSRPRATAGRWPTGSGISTRGCLPNCLPTLAGSTAPQSMARPTSAQSATTTATLCCSSSVKSTRPGASTPREHIDRDRDDETPAPRLAHHPAVKADPG